LNFVVNDDGIERDFDSVYLVSSPYYSSVKNKEVGFNNILNYPVLLKKETNVAGGRLINFDHNLSSRKNAATLNYEHETELLKAIMQAVGRCERRNTNTYTNIYMDFDIYKKVCIQYYNFKKSNENNQVYWKANRY